MNYELLIEFPSTGQSFKTDLTADCVEYAGHDPSRVHVIMNFDSTIVDAEPTYMFTFKGVLVDLVEEDANILFRIYGKDYNDLIVEFVEADYYLCYTAFSDCTEDDPSQDFKISLPLTFSQHSKEWVEHILPKLFKGAVK